MSSFWPGSDRCSSRRPVARRIADAHERGRITVAGRITSTRGVRHGSGSALRCQLDDGSGTIDLLFLGRTEVPGFVVGTRCTIEGTVQRDALGLVTWNPRYQLEVRQSEWAQGERFRDRLWQGCDDRRQRPQRG